MEYLVFPFGKYKGTKLEELPSTYIMLALEKFELPNELQAKLRFIALGRLGAFKFFKEILEAGTKEDVIKSMTVLIENF